MFTAGGSASEGRSAGSEDGIGWRKFCPGDGGGGGPGVCAEGMRGMGKSLMAVYERQRMSELAMDSMLEQCPGGRPTFSRRDTRVASRSGHDVLGGGHMSVPLFPARLAK